MCNASFCNSREAGFFIFKIVAVCDIGF